MIERQGLRSMLRDMGVQTLPPHKHDNGQSHEYSEELYSYLESTARQHDVNSTYELLQFIQERNSAKPFWYVIENNDDWRLQGVCTHKAYLLDYPKMGMRFNWHTGFQMRKVEDTLETLLYREHGALMKHKIGVPFPRDWKDVYRGSGTTHQLQLGELYALKMAAWNESLDERELPPPLQNTLWRDHYH